MSMKAQMRAGQEEKHKGKKCQDRSQTRTEEGKTKRMSKHPLVVRSRRPRSGLTRPCTSIQPFRSISKRPSYQPQPCHSLNPSSSSSPAVAPFMLLPLALVDAVVELQIWLFGLWVITGSKTL